MRFWPIILLGMLPICAAAEPGLEAAPIRAIVLHVNQDVEASDLLPRLRARLERDLVPPLYEDHTEIDLSTMPGSFGQLDGEALLQGVAAQIDPVREQGVIHILLIAPDMKGAATRFNFALSLGGADQAVRVIVISMARLAHPDPDLTAARVARLIVKNVARTAGYSGSELCVFGFARSLAELDAMPESFCEPDRSTLVRAGLAR